MAQHVLAPTEVEAMLFNSWISSAITRTCVRCGRSCWSDTCATCLHAPPSAWRTSHGHRVIALGLYTETPGSLVQALKFSEETHLAALLGKALGRLVPLSWQDCVLLPTPLHSEKLAQRGYNQSALLARAIARQAEMSATFNALRRKKQTSAQARLSPIQRGRNMEDAFVAESSLAQKRFVLVDDVVTTGHTIDACALAVVAKGASVCGVLACALSRQSIT